MEDICLIAAFLFIAGICYAIMDCIDRFLQDHQEDDS